MSDVAVSELLIVAGATAFRAVLADALSTVCPQARVTLHDPHESGLPESAGAVAPFDLVILDGAIAGPDLDLDAAAERLQQRDGPAVLIMVDAGTDPCVATGFDAAGAYRCSKRGFDSGVLAAAIEAALSDRFAAALRMSSDPSAPERAQAQMAQRASGRGGVASRLVRDPAPPAVPSPQEPNFSAPGAAAAPIDLRAARSTVLEREPFRTRLATSIRQVDATAGMSLLVAGVEDLERLRHDHGLLAIRDMQLRLGTRIAEVLAHEGARPVVARLETGTLGIMVRDGVARRSQEHWGKRVHSVARALPFSRHGRVVEESIDVHVGVVPMGSATRDLSAGVLLELALIAARRASLDTARALYLLQPPYDAYAGELAHGARDLHAAMTEQRMQMRLQPLAGVSAAAANLNANFYQCRTNLAARGEAPLTISDLLAHSDCRRTLDRWVVRESLSHLTAMGTSGVRRGGMLLRMSGATLEDGSFEPWFARLAGHLPAPQLLRAMVFEVGAMEVADLGQKAASVIKTLRARYGSKFALTDASDTGAVERCQRLAPFEFVKLAAPADADEAESTDAARDFAEVVEATHEAGALAVAERVEQSGQLAQALRLGVDFVQGYLIANPRHDAHVTDTPLHI